jgi:hypothetical protein
MPNEDTVDCISPSLSILFAGKEHLLSETTHAWIWMVGSCAQLTVHKPSLSYNNNNNKINCTNASNYHQSTLPRTCPWAKARGTRRTPVGAGGRTHAPSRHNDSCGSFFADPSRSPCMHLAFPHENPRTCSLWYLQHQKHSLLLRHVQSMFSCCQCFESSHSQADFFNCFSSADLCNL